MSFLRLHEAVPFGFIRVFLPLQIGRKLRERPELADADIGCAPR
jgi:hypothetical protein